MVNLSLQVCYMFMQIYIYNSKIIDIVKKRSIIDRCTIFNIIDVKKFINQNLNIKKYSLMSFDTYD